MKHLNELSLTEKIQLAAELDRWTIIGDNAKHPIYTLDKWTFKGRTVPDYPHSYDAIIPLIQKQTTEMKDVIGETIWQMYSKEWHCYCDATPSQLLDATLVATGKATI
jgi:hypothetical protein